MLTHLVHTCNVIIRTWVCDSGIVCYVFHMQYHVRFVGGIFYSSNGGTSWLKSNAPDKVWRDIATSANGQYLSAGLDGKMQWRTYLLISIIRFVISIAISLSWESLILLQWQYHILLVKIYYHYYTVVLSSLLFKHGVPMIIIAVIIKSIYVALIINRNISSAHDSLCCV